MRVFRRASFLASFALVTALAGVFAAGAALAPAIIGQARAAGMTMKFSSSQANDPKYANGRVYYENLRTALKANGLDGQINVQFFPDNQLGQEIDVINSVKLGVIDMMVSGTSIAANLVPLVGPLWYLIETGFCRGTHGSNAYGQDLT